MTEQTKRQSCRTCEHLGAKRGSTIGHVCTLTGLQVLPIMKACPLYLLKPDALPPSPEEFYITLSPESPAPTK